MWSIEISHKLIFSYRKMSNEYQTLRRGVEGSQEETYLIPIKIRAPLNFRAFNFRASNLREPSDFTPIFCKFAVFSFIRGVFSSPFTFGAIVLRQLPPFNSRTG